jgi:hypothetical protein
MGPAGPRGPATPVVCGSERTGETGNKVADRAKQETVAKKISFRMVDSQ